MISRTIHVEEIDVSRNVSVKQKQNCLRAQCFELYQLVPAPMCDGGDWTKDLMIRLDDEDFVHIRWERKERSGLHLIKLPYSEFFDKFADFAETLEKEMKANANSS